MQNSIGADTARGVFVAAAVGDALGWPQEFRGGLVGGKKARDEAEPAVEFRRWERTGGYRAHRFRDPVAAGQYSDDTQLLLVTARACLAGDQWWERLVHVELPTWPIYQRGGGGAVLKATNSWADRCPPWRRGTTKRSSGTVSRYLNAGANGVAMRIAPHIFWADDHETLIDRVFQDGIATHGHPRALVGALAYVSALRHAATSTHTLEFGEIVEAARRGLVPADRVEPLLPPDWATSKDRSQFVATWTVTNREMSDLIDMAAASVNRGAVSRPTATLQDLGCADTKVNGAGTITAAGAVYLAARFASRPEGALLSAAYLPNGDTDTLASMTAALLGATHGTSWLPPAVVETVQDHDYLVALATRTADRDITVPPEPVLDAANYRKHLPQLVVSVEAANSHVFPDGRKAALASVDRLDGGKATRVVLHLDDGQTVQVDLLDDLLPPTRPAGGERDRNQPTLDEDSVHGNARSGGDGDSTSRGGDADATASEKTSPQQLKVEELVSGSHSDMPLTSKQARNIDAHGRNVQEAPGEATGHRVALDGVVVATANLAKCAAFYARLLARDVSIQGRSIQLTPWLRLTETGGPGDHLLRIAVTVPDVRSAAARMNAKPPADGQPLVVTDPDNRTVTVTRR